MRSITLAVVILLFAGIATIAVAGEAVTGAADAKPRQDPMHPVTQPEYPVEARRDGSEGAVILDFVVRPDGQVEPSSIGVEESSGYPVLDDAAVAEAAKWRFLPATRNGAPVAAIHQFRVVFQLSDDTGIMPTPAEDFPGVLEDDPAVHVPLNLDSEGEAFDPAAAPPNAAPPSRCAAGCGDPCGRPGRRCGWR